MLSRQALHTSIGILGRVLWAFVEFFAAFEFSNRDAAQLYLALWSFALFVAFVGLVWLRGCVAGRPSLSPGAPNAGPSPAA